MVVPHPPTGLAARPVGPEWPQGRGSLGPGKSSARRKQSHHLSIDVLQLSGIANQARCLSPHEDASLPIVNVHLGRDTVLLQGRFEDTMPAAAIRTAGACAAGCIEGAAIIDLAPTILTIMGLPLLPDFDGRVLSELVVGIRGKGVDEPQEPDEPGGDSEPYSQEEAKQVKDLLRGLGYIG